MNKPTIPVTGATGKTGSATAVQLLAAGYPVRAFVHRQDARSERLRTAGAEIVCGSLEDFSDLQTALQSVQRAYFCPPLEYGTLRRASLFAAAAQSARLEVVVALSQWAVDPCHQAVHSREKWLSDQLFAWMPDVDVVTINPGFLADNYMATLDTVTQLGLFGMPLGEGMNAPPSNEDVARVIVGALTHPANYIGKSYRPTGPHLLSPEDIATTFAKILGRPVKYQNAPLPLFLKVAKSLQLSEFVIEQLYWYLQDYQRNVFAIGAPTDAVIDIGGLPPEDFEQIGRRYLAAYGRARRTAANTLHVICNVLTAIVRPTPNLAAISRRLAIPQIKHATLAADSPLWLSTHVPPQTNGRSRDN